MKASFVTSLIATALVSSFAQAGEANGPTGSSSVELMLAAQVDSDVISAALKADAKPSDLKGLLVGYNYGLITSEDGRLKQVIVSGRNGSAKAQKRMVAAAAPAARDEMLGFAANPADLPEKYKTYRAGSAVSIELHGDALKQMKLGQKVNLTLPTGTVEVIHDNRFSHENGDVTWVGYLSTAGKGYRAIITLSDHGSMGQVVTPDGVFNIDFENGSNWLVDMSSSGLQSGSMEHDEMDHELAAFDEGATGEPDALTTARADAHIVMAEGKAAKKKKKIKKTIATTTAPQQDVEVAPVVTAITPATNTIDVMVLYTKGMNPSTVDTRLNYLVSKTNQAYIDSQINLSLRLVAKQLVDYAEQSENGVALADLTSGRGGFAAVSSLRQQYGADLVALIRPFNYASHKGCGMAWVNGANGGALTRESGFAVVSDGTDGSSGWYCTDYTFAHEIGHNLGSVHDAGHSSTQGKFPYSYGHGSYGKFGTIMSYINPGVGIFSNPNLMCQGEPCGIAGAADNSRSINLTSGEVSKFYEAKQ